MVTRPALSDPELIDFPGLGTLEAFNTDGLRSLAQTIPCPNMKEKKRSREVSPGFRMLDRYDPLTGTHSMARPTGYTATAAVRMLTKSLYKEPGIAPPEMIGRHKEPFDFIIRCLRQRRVVRREEVSGGSPILP
jgi:saccharopine dehydrogenase-like NADP-dependent oxidoreductase